MPSTASVQDRASRGLEFVIVRITFLATQWRQYTPFGQMPWVLALFAIGVDAGMGWCSITVRKA